MLIPHHYDHEDSSPTENLPYLHYKTQVPFSSTPLPYFFFAIHIHHHHRPPHPLHHNSLSKTPLARVQPILTETTTTAPPKMGQAIAKGFTGPLPEERCNYQPGRMGYGGQQHRGNRNGFPPPGMMNPPGTQRTAYRPPGFGPDGFYEGSPPVRRVFRDRRGAMHGMGGMGGGVMPGGGMMHPGAMPGPQHFANGGPAGLMGIPFGGVMMPGGGMMHPGGMPGPPHSAAAMGGGHGGGGMMPGGPGGVPASRRRQSQGARTAGTMGGAMSGHPMGGGGHPGQGGGSRRHRPSRRNGDGRGGGHGGGHGG